MSNDTPFDTDPDPDHHQDPGAALDSEQDLREMAVAVAGDERTVDELIQHWEDTHTNGSTAPFGDDTPTSLTDLPPPVQDALEGAPLGDADRPALDTLTTDQLSLVGQLVGDFDARADILRWLQKVTIHTLGEPSEWWLREMAFNGNVVSALLGRPWGSIDEPPSEAVQQEIRYGTAALDLLDFCLDAQRKFRWSALEYHGEDVDPDPHEQAHPAMRPSLGTLDERQAWALDQVLGGFDDPEEFLVWGFYLVRSSYAEIARETIKDAYFQRVTDYLCWTGEPGTERARTARIIREDWAAEYLLPTFNDAAARVATHAAEIAETDDTAGGEFNR